MELDPLRPGTYPRRILLAVTGLSPQVITETLYALAVRPGDAEARFVPTEIQIITTLRGRDQAINNLLSDQPGWFHRLCSDYSLPGIRFDVDCIHVVSGADGAPLEDIRTPHDNECAANFITEKVRELTSDDRAALHVSLAGGRKTMGFYLGYALSLFARPQDRLSHVLVSQPYESHPDFYYPPPRQSILQSRDKTPIAVDARDAQILLAEIPVVSLRHGLPRHLLSGTATFKATVDSARAALEFPDLVIDVRKRRVRAAGRVFGLPATVFAVLAVLAYRTHKGLPPLRAPKKDCIDREWSSEYLKNLRAACGEWHVPSGVEEALIKGVDGAYFSPHLSRLRKLLEEELGPAARSYRIDEGTGRHRRYKLAVPPDRIRFGNIES